MKKTLLIALLISNGAIAQTSYFYGPQGQYVGQTTTSGNNTFVYGAQGQDVGQITRQAVPSTMPIPMLVVPVYQAAPIYTPNPASLTPIYDSIFGR